MQLTTNGTDYVDGPVIAVSVGSTYVYQTVDLSAVPGVADNLDFAFRIVTEFESTATGSGTTGYVATATSYGTSGTIRYDQVSIFALPLPLEISGTVELEGFAGLARNGTGQRAVTFVVTDIATNQLAPVTLTLNFTNGAVGYVLTNLPATPSLLSAKTTWNLRQRQPVSLLGARGSANFFLGGGDLDDSNFVDAGDFFGLAADWYETEPGADLDGSGLVDVLD